MQKYNVQTVPVASAARLGAKPVRLMGFVIFPSAANSSVEFKNAATDTGDVLLTYSTLASSSCFVDLSEFGGIEFSVGCFVKPAGANSIVYCFYE
jgi:hypothetical protein